MGDAEIINRLLEQTTHLVRQAWAPVVVGSNYGQLCINMVTIKALKLHCSALSGRGVLFLQASTSHKVWREQTLQVKRLLVI